MKNFLIFTIFLIPYFSNAQCTMIADVNFTLPDGIATNACENYGLIQFTITPITDCANIDANHFVLWEESRYDFHSAFSSSGNALVTQGNNGAGYDFVNLIENINPDSDGFYETYTVNLKPSSTWSAFGDRHIIVILENDQDDEFEVADFNLNNMDVIPVRQIDATNNTLSGQGNYTSGLFHPADLYIEDDLIIDLDNVGFLGLDEKDNIYLNPGSEIIVLDNISTSFEKVQFVACEDISWKGFTLGDNASLSLTNNNVTTADRAIKTTGNATLDLSDNTFDRNQIDLDFDGSVGNNGILNINTFQNNTFKNSGPLLTTSYGLPPSAKSMYNIKVKNYPFIDLKAPNELNANIFKDANINIFSSNTNAMISYNKFETSGTAIQLGGSANQSDVHFNIFQDKTKGVQVTTHGIRSSENTFNNVNIGYRLAGTQNRLVEINDNEINATDNGIFNFFNEGASIFENNINILNNNSDAIGLDLIYSNDSKTNDNIISIGGIHAGVMVSSSIGNNVSENDIYLTNGNLGTRGVDLMDATGSIIRCNAIEGAGSAGFTRSTGLFFQFTTSNLTQCNTLNDLADGMIFRGGNDGDIAGNTFGNLGFGLQIGDEDYEGMATCGQQIHRGNIWTNSAQNVGAYNISDNNSILEFSKFDVDANENSTFLPSIINPAEGWFRNIAIPSLSYYCAGQDACLGSGAGTSVSGNNIPSDKYVDWVDTHVSNIPDVSDNVKWVYQSQLAEVLITQVPNTEYTPTINLFLNNSNNQEEILFAEIQQEINLALDNNSDISAISNQIAANIDNYNMTSNPSYLYDNINLKSQLTSTIESNDVNKSTHLSNAQNMLDGVGFATPGSAQSDYQYVYQALINYITNSYTLSANELNNLNTIAAKCPTEYGKATSISRALLRAEQGTVFDDYANCIDKSKPRSKIISGYDEDVTIYPNPASDILYFSTTVSHVNILDIHGRLITQYTSDRTNSLDISNLLDGVYIVEYMNSTNVERQKIIKQ